MDKTTFKQSSIGLIPFDWEVKRLGEIAIVKGGKRIPKGENLVNENTGFPYIRVSDMYMGGIDISKILFIPAHVEPLIKNYKISKDDLFITVAGTVGLVGEIPSELDNANLTENANKISVKNANKKYILYILSSDLIQNIIIATTTNNAQPKLALERIRDFQLPIPALPEQQKIATILSTWDTAIDNCKAIIDNLKNRNIGLAHQLLSGKKRTIEFEKNIKEDFYIVEKFLKEISIKNSKLEVKRVLSVTNNRGFINQSEQFDREVASADLTNYKIVKKNQFAYNPSRVNVGSLDLLKTFEEGILSPMYVVFETDTKKLLPDFFHHHLKTYWFKGHIPMFIQGSVRDSLSFNGLCGMKFFIPSIEEQKAITNILDKATEELNQYQQKLKNLLIQKKGLMQQLLTGKTRVKI